MGLSKGIAQQMNIKFIQPHELREQWAWVKLGLERVRDKGHSEWIVEDIYCDLYESRSLLWIATEGDVNTGFMVLQPMGSTMHVWAAYMESGSLEQGFEHIKNIAKLGNCNKLTFSSNRVGWAKRAKRMGFVQKVWELTI